MSERIEKPAEPEGCWCPECRRELIHRAGRRLCPSSKCQYIEKPAEREWSITLDEALDYMDWCSKTAEDEATESAPLIRAHIAEMEDRLAVVEPVKGVCEKSPCGEWHRITWGGRSTPWVKGGPDSAWAGLDGDPISPTAALDGAKGEG